MNPDRLEELAEAHLRGALDQEEALELARLLDESSAAQARFVKFAELETALTSYHRGSLADVRKKPEGTTKFNPALWRIAPWVAVAACLAFLVWPKLSREAKESGPTARLVNEAGARFADSPGGSPGKFNPGTYELLEGMIHLLFANGAEFVAEGPTKFQIMDDRQTRVLFGQVRAIVPPDAEGFAIVTGDAAFQDPGTEFGLKINRESGGISEIYAFNGTVKLRDPKSSLVIDTLHEGQSAAYRNGTAVTMERTGTDEFADPDVIGIRRWQSQQARRLSDPDLIAYFPFENAPDDPDALINLKQEEESTVSPGRIHGARWVSGRWTGKNALLFDRPTDFAEFEIEGEFEEFTTTAWVLVDRLDNFLNAILNSNGWEKGDLHFQVTRFGNPYVDIFESVVSRKKTSRNPPGVIPGEWVHLATTISLPEGKANVYINGKLSEVSTLKKNGPLRPGICRLGNWSPVGSYNSIRAFSGRIDELAIWKRALGEAEIRAEYELGRSRLEPGENTVAPLISLVDL